MRNLFRASVAVFAFVAVACACCAVSAVAAEKVKAWEGTVSLPTYPWQEDVNPAFWALEGGKGLPAAKGSIVYPYTMQDHLSRSKVDRTYKALFLENEYLKVTCLPELGGRLHSVLDKTTNQEMFHASHVIKPGMIAMRGAWISGGVEWNTGPHGHTVTAVSPVDVFHGESPDGSAFLEINNTEKIFRTRWTVRLTLRPGRAYLDEQIRLANPTDGVHPYYFWNCTAFPNRPGTRFIYPMTLGTDHNGTAFFNWPIDKGKDLTWLKNYDSPTSVFAHKCEFDFFGAYDVEADRGIVSTADHRYVPGKKAWTWGECEFGKVAQKNLTDEDGAYIEVQSGPLPTQSDYGLLGPHDVVAWQEYWYAVHGLGDGFEYATKDLAFETVRKEGKLQLRVIATREIPRATLVVSRQASGGTELLRSSVDLSPRRVQSATVADVGSAPVTICVTGPDGAEIAQFQSPLPIPKVTPPDPATFRQKPDEEMTVEELYFRGRKFDRDTNRLRAREYYGKALAKDAGHVASLRALAVLDVEAGLYQEAAARCRKALERDPDDARLWYYLGVSQFRLGQFKEAGESGRRSAECFGTASLGYDLGGRAAMRLGDTAKAIDLFAAAVRVSPDDERAHDHLLVALFAAGRPDEARGEARRRLAARPSDLVPRLVLGTLSEGRGSLGEAEFELLDASLVLDELGATALAESAVGQLVGRDASKPKCGPLPLYYLAYFTAKGTGGSPNAAREDSAKRLLTAAAAMSQDFAFPSRPEEVDVFKFAVEHNPGDAFAKVHLGNLLANLGRLDEATALWEKAAAANPAPAMTLRNLGLVVWARGDLAKAESLYRKAAEARPGDQTLFRDLADILLAAGKRPEAIKVMASMPVQGAMRAEIVIALAQAYVDEKRYDDAVKLLESIPYLVNWEGQDLSWRLFNTAHLERGKQRLENRDLAAALADFEAALTYPANLNVGRSARPQEAPAQYWRGRTLAELGRPQEARAAWQAGADGREGSAAQNEYIQRCREALDKKR